MIKPASLLAALVLTAGGPAHAGPLGTLDAAVASGRRVVLPLHVRSGFAFMEGRVNGIAGDFMFDTGTPFALFLNRDLLKLSAGREIAHGSASSGQKITVADEGCIDSVSLGPGYEPASLCDMRSGNLGFVQKAIDPKLLGFAGLGLFKGFQAAFDLPNRRLIFSRSRPTNETPLTVIRFPADQPLPRFTLSAADVELEGRMDTGDAGHINLTQADADQLTAAGLLVTTRPRRGAPARLVLARVRHEGDDLDTADLPVTVGGEHSDAMIGLLFFKRHLSVWDLERRTVTLYREQARSPHGGSRPQGGRRRGASD